jgi:hypothetical protein
MICWPCFLHADVCQSDMVSSSAIITANTAPSINLVTYPNLGIVALVPQYNGYHRCNTTSAGDPEVPLVGQPCDPGAQAYDFEDGNITSKVMICPPSTCNPTTTASCEGRHSTQQQASGLLHCVHVETNTTHVPYQQHQHGCVPGLVLASCSLYMVKAQAAAHI